MNEKQIVILILLSAVFIGFIILANVLDNKSINGIKSKKVGDGQYGTARWATKSEIRQTFSFLPFEPQKWRKGEALSRQFRELLSAAAERLIQLHLLIQATFIR